MTAVLLIGTIGELITVLVVLWWARGEESRWYESGWEDGRAWLERRIEDAMPPERLEVLFEDWGVEHGPMRWRWAVWSADRALDVLVHEDLEQRSPQDVVVGIHAPYMLGNAPTRALAEAEALAWIHGEGTGTALYDPNRLVVG